jgi:hypothetical protein
VGEDGRQDRQLRRLRARSVTAAENSGRAAPIRQTTGTGEAVRNAIGCDLFVPDSIRWDGKREEESDSRRERVGPQKPNGG